METVVITGGTGLVGTALRQALLDKGYRVIVLVRELPAPSQINQGLEFALWDIAKQTIDNTAIAHADHIIHLAGENIAEKRWTEERKQKIVSSRVDGCRLLVKSIQTVPNRIKTVISASAIGWYGEDPVVPNPHPFIETDPPAGNFLGTTCRDWEAAIEPVTASGIRLVKIRTGIVISSKGGAFKEFIKPMKWGVAAIIGNGRQIISWIGLDDLLNLYIAAIENQKMSGAYNGVSPHPVSNRELTLTLARKRRKFFIPVQVPAFIIKAKLGEMSLEVLKSTTVSCKKIMDTGFTFTTPRIADALER